jgi:hypothetical protein
LWHLHGARSTDSLGFDSGTGSTFLALHRGQAGFTGSAGVSAAGAEQHGAVRLSASVQQQPGERTFADWHAAATGATTARANWLNTAASATVFIAISFASRLDIALKRGQSS